MGVYRLLAQGRLGDLGGCRSISGGLRRGHGPLPVPQHCLERLKVPSADDDHGLGDAANEEVGEG